MTDYPGTVVQPAQPPASPVWPGQIVNMAPDPAPVVQHMNDNLNKPTEGEGEQKPQDIHSTVNDATGMDVNKILSSDNTYGPPVPENIRKHYVDCIQNGSCTGFGDYMHSMLPHIANAAMDILDGGAGKQPTASVAAESYIHGVQESNAAIKAVATGEVFSDKPIDTPPKDYVAQLTAQPLSEGYNNRDWWAATVANAFGSMTGTVGAIGAGTAVGTAVAGPAGGLAGAMVGGGGGGLVQSLAQSYRSARAQGLDDADAKDQAWKVSVTNAAVNALMVMAPQLKLFGTTPQMVAGKLTEFAKKPIMEALTQIAVVQPAIGAGGQAAQSIETGQPLTGSQIATGYAQNVAFGTAAVLSHATRQIVGKAVGKPPEVVTPADVQTVTQNTDSLAPNRQNFLDHGFTVGMLNGKPERVNAETLQKVYSETGVKPPQVEADARTNPAVAADVAEGKVPAAYDHLRTPPPVTEATAKPVAPAPETLSPEHKALQDKYGVPEEMTKQMLTRRDGQLQTEMVNAKNLTDAQFYALEQYQKRVEGALASTGAPKGAAEPVLRQPPPLEVNHADHKPANFKLFALRGKYPPTVEGTNRAAKDFVVQEGAKNGKEHAVIVDENGKATHYVKGRKGSVTIPEDIHQKNTADVDKYTFHHNHPGGAPLSRGDWTSDIPNPSIKETYAHGDKGEVYRGSRTEAAKRMTGTGAGKEAFRAVVKSAYRKAGAITKEVITANLKASGVKSMSGHNVTKVIGELFNRALDKAGVVHYSSSEDIHGMTPEQQQTAINQIARQIQKVIREHGQEKLPEGETRNDYRGRSPGDLTQRGAVPSAGGPGRGAPRGAPGEATGKLEEGPGGVKEEEPSNIDPEKDLGPINSQPHAEAATHFAGRIMSQSKSKLNDFIHMTVEMIPQDIREKAGKLGNALVLATDPMSAGSKRAQAIVKDFANKMTWLNINAVRTFDYLTKNFSPTELKGMWNALDESSVYATMHEANAREAELTQARADGMEPDEAIEHVDQQANKDARREASKAETERNNIGHFALPENQKRVVQMLSDYSTVIYDAAKASGLAKGDGLPFWTPRMAAMIGSDGAWGKPPKEAGAPPNTTHAGGLTAAPPESLLHRKYLTSEQTEAAMKAHFEEQAGDENNVMLVRDIRTMVYAMHRLHQAVTGRELINEIKNSGKDLVVDSEEQGFFRIDHPAFTTYTPRMFDNTETGKREPVRYPDGTIVMDKKPLYVSKEFEGPLRSILDQRTGELTNALVALKGKSMSYIMWSFMKHNAVIWSKAAAVDPVGALSGYLYFKGNAARRGIRFEGDTDVPVLKQASAVWNHVMGKYKDDVTAPEPMKVAVLVGGMKPIGKRFFNQELTGILDETSVVPGQSLESRLLGNAVGVVNREAGEGVKRAIDAFGNWHNNTMLWDRVADIQMGIYQHEVEKALNNGIHPIIAAKQAGDVANMFAGSLPIESMSKAARTLGNIALFSRSFTMGNILPVKRLLMGMPGDALAQIERELGPEQAAKANSYSRRRAAGILMLEYAMYKGSLTLLQDAADEWNKKKDLSQIEQGYVDRLQNLVHNSTALQLLNPFRDINKLVSTTGHEPGKENAIEWSTAPDGTKTYFNDPLGKIGHDLEGWFGGSPGKTLATKESTIVKPLVDIAQNRDFFGQQVYDDKDRPDILDQAHILAQCVEHILVGGLPSNDLKDIKNAVIGGPDAERSRQRLEMGLAGISVSHGYPHGPAAAEYHEALQKHEKEVDHILPDVKKAVEGGDFVTAREVMDKVNLTEPEQNRLIKYYEGGGSALNSRNMEKFERIATPEEKERMDEIEGQENK